MSYLKFDRRLMANLDESTQREYIRTNRKGAYSCSSIVGCNTRKYHGLLVIPVPSLSANNHVLLSSLDLTIIQHGVPFNVGIHEYEGDVFSPKGHKYIREYNVDVVSSTTYRVGGVILEKQFLFCHYVNRAITRYTLLEAHSRTTLRLSPFLAFRDVKMLTHRNDQINGDYGVARSGVTFCLYPGYPTLYLQVSKEHEFVSDPHWNEKNEYIKERERGYEYTEDLYVPGYFDVDIEVGESVYFSAGIEEADPASLAQLFDHAYHQGRLPKLSAECSAPILLPPRRHPRLPAGGISLVRSASSRSLHRTPRLYHLRGCARALLPYHGYRPTRSAGLHESNKPLHRNP